MENSVVPSNEMEANRPANPESGEGHNQSEETRTEHVISVKERFRTLMGSDASVKEEDKPSIGQVPVWLGELKQYFQPRIMSIGPLHHGKNELEEGQQYKIYLTKVFIEQSYQSEETLYDNILKEIKSFKEFYNHHELLKFGGDDMELAWMFFVDGCALIQFVRCYEGSGGYFVSIGLDQVNLMVTDLMLLDNQLPLGVLNLVMGFSKEGGELYQNDHPVGKRSKECRRLIYDFIKNIEARYFNRWEKGVNEHSVTDQSFNKANHLLELIWMNFVKKEKEGYSPKTEATSRPFLSVKDLQAAGIRLEPNRSSSSLLHISFDRGILFWKLKIPSLLVDEQGKFLLFNLIAFEMHPNFSKDLVVTSYLSFLNSLIANKEDVAELRKAGILSNRLPNDQEVFKTFRELTSILKPYPDIFYYTKQELIAYFNDLTTGKWFSQAMQVYFRSPWTTIAFNSATVLLILAIIQTIFSVLAYLVERNNSFQKKL